LPYLLPLPFPLSPPLCFVLSLYSSSKEIGKKVFTAFNF
jgi:hypothetical protein